VPPAGEPIGRSGSAAALLWALLGALLGGLILNVHARASFPILSLKL
jgi:hypothetical protein